MRQRCTNPRSAAFYRYGARGITVRWQAFAEFAQWAQDSGYEPHLTLDRIDNDGHYEPGNCRWVDAKVQANNRASNRTGTFDGETKTLAQWAEDTRCAVSYKALHLRVTRQGMPFAEALTTKHRRPRGADECGHGHLWTPENTLVPPTGGRRCRECAHLRYLESKSEVSV